MKSGEGFAFERVFDVLEDYQEQLAHLNLN